MVIGTDYHALSGELSRRIGVPVFSFDTNGIDYYDQGVSQAFFELARHFVKPVSPVDPSGVNIIGATPLDLGNNGQIDILKRLLTEAGYRIVSCWSMGSTIGQISRSAEAGLNIVVSYSGLKTARYLEKILGMPYIVGLPVGVSQLKTFFGEIAEWSGFSGNYKNPVPDENSGCGISRALIVGEQVMSNSIRTCLIEDFQVEEVTVVSYFRMDPELTEKGDLRLFSEEDLSDLTTQNSFDLVIADPLYRELLPVSFTGKFAEFPHTALSGRLYWDEDVRYIGMDGYRFFQSLIFHSD
jgi:hypothetical protein